MQRFVRRSGRVSPQPQEVPDCNEEKTQGASNTASEQKPSDKGLLKNLKGRAENFMNASFRDRHLVQINEFLCVDRVPKSKFRKDENVKKSVFESFRANVNKLINKGEYVEQRGEYLSVGHYSKNRYNKGEKKEKKPIFESFRSNVIKLINKGEYVEQRGEYLSVGHYGKNRYNKGEKKEIKPLFDSFKANVNRFINKGEYVEQRGEYLSVGHYGKNRYNKD